MKLRTGKDVLGEDKNYKVPMELLMKKHENEFRCSLCQSTKHVQNPIETRQSGEALRRGRGAEVLRQRAARDRWRCVCLFVWKHEEEQEEESGAGNERERKCETEKEWERNR